MSIIAAGGVVATVGVAVVGWLIKRWRNKKRQEREDKSAMDDRVERLEQRVSTLWRWAFGREDDETDGGVAVEIQESLDRIEEDIGELEKRQDTYHDSEMEQLYRLVNALHDEENLDFERDDVFNDER